jgi:membrane-associated phospholipid phosphatase
MILINSSRITAWFLLLLVNIVYIVIIYYSTLKYELQVSNNAHLKTNIIKLLRFWYAVPLILICFKEVHIIIQAIGNPDIDPFLIKMDLWLFCVNPTEWFYRFENPVLTEFLQIIYLLYYFLILFYGLELYLWNRLTEFLYSVFVILLSFYICYVFYIIFPAAGPRFYIHDFHTITKDLPGLFTTHYIRLFLDFGESINADLPNPLLYAQRDAMPSAHLALAIILAYLSKKFKSKSFYFYLPYCFLMAVSTIYLRYHYVVDLIAGAVLALAAIIISMYFERYYNLK